MSKIINGKKYMLVDVVVMGDFIYDIYEDEQGNKIKVYCDYVRDQGESYVFYIENKKQGRTGNH